jgi:hypothetical protein
MTGGKSKFVDMAAIQKMEKAIPAKKEGHDRKKERQRVVYSPFSSYQLFLKPARESLRSFD